MSEENACAAEALLVKGSTMCKVLTHEIGHLFGMGHSSEPADVMSPFYNTTVKLSDNDKARIAELLKESSVSA